MSGASLRIEGETLVLKTPFVPEQRVQLDRVVWVTAAVSVDTYRAELYLSEDPARRAGRFRTKRLPGTVLIPLNLFSDRQLVPALAPRLLNKPGVTMNDRARRYLSQTPEQLAHWWRRAY